VAILAVDEVMLREPRLLVPRMGPVGLVKPDYSNPLANQLRSAILPTAAGRLVDIISGAKPTSDTATVRATATGRAAEYSLTNVTEFAGTPVYRVTSDWSILLDFDLDAASNYSHLVSCSQSTTTSGWELRGGETSSDRKIRFIKMTAYSYRDCTGPVDAIGIGANILVIANDSLVETTPVASINGIPISLTVTGSITGSIAAGTGNLRFGQRLDTVTRLDGAIRFFALWHRKLTQAECNELSANPYQLLSPA
jgi:hypothetical protein